MNIHTIAEDIRARLNEMSSGRPDASHHAAQSNNVVSSFDDERYALRQLEALIDRLGY